MDKVIDLTKGGLAVVFIGNTGLVKEYANNPSVKFIECKHTPAEELSAIVPDNTKAVLFSEGLPQFHYAWMVSYAKRKGIPYLLRKSNQAMYETIKSFFPNGSKNGEEKVTIEEVRETSSRGKLKELLALVDWSDSNANQARRLLQIATERNIKTTFGALTQAIAVERRKKGMGTVPKSARSQLDISVEMLDEAIKNLGDMRDFLISTTEENRMLKLKLERFKKAMEE